MLGSQGYTNFDPMSPFYGSIYDPPSSTIPTSTSQGTNDSYGQSSTYFSDPSAAGAAGGSLSELIAQMSGGYDEFVNDPTSHPAFQNALSGLLAALHPGEQAGMRDLADMYRAAGNTSSSAFGESANKYQQGVDRNRMELASGLLAKLYPQIAGAMYAPISQTAGLMDAYKLSQQSQESHGQNTQSSGASGNSPLMPLSGGGGGGASSWTGGWASPSFQSF